MGLVDQIPREGRIAVTLTCARGLPDTRGRPCTRPGHRRERASGSSPLPCRLPTHSSPFVSPSSPPGALAAPSSVPVRQTRMRWRGCAKPRSPKP
jgi:hypothetical protein